ncbi:MAG TPA: homoserine O-succinyltransferase [Xanthobacteraceae bacterium]|nr:homoserine O-succinyltransferase [Xanthobacteraceae bacterium]
MDGTALGRKSGLPLRDRDALVIGLVNNMPDTELGNTEKQFGDLLDAASSGLPVRLRLLALPEVPRSDAGRAQISERYEDLAALADKHIDGLIVTGTEPRAPSLTEEPFWPAFTRLVDWAQEHTLSTIWSCLAAHAAILYLDGIERHAFPGKLSGVFKCEKSADHDLVESQPSEWFVPHSRHNGLAEDMLAARGHRILLRSPETGPDMFVRQSRSLFLFLQGHPEYDRHALHREYRRDVGRFLRGRSDGYPEIPHGYFDADTTEVLAKFRARALRNRSPELLAEFPGIPDAAIVHSWHAAAVALYRQWLACLYAERTRSGLRRFRSRSSRRESLTQIAGMA